MFETEVSFIHALLLEVKQTNKFPVFSQYSSLTTPLFAEEFVTIQI